MTREEAIKALEQISDLKEAYNKGYKDGQEALAYHLELCKEEAEPCEDCIQPKPKTAKWQRVMDGAWFYEQCSSCGSVHDVKSNYCPKCGAKMEGSEDGKSI